MRRFYGEECAGVRAGKLFTQKKEEEKLNTIGGIDSYYRIPVAGLSKSLKNV